MLPIYFFDPISLPPSPLFSHGIFFTGDFMLESNFDESIFNNSIIWSKSIEKAQQAAVLQPSLFSFLLRNVFHFSLVTTMRLPSVLSGYFNPPLALKTKTNIITCWKSRAIFLACLFIGCFTASKYKNKRFSKNVFFVKKADCVKILSDFPKNKIKQKNFFESIPLAILKCKASLPFLLTP